MIRFTYPANNNPKGKKSCDSKPLGFDTTEGTKAIVLLPPISTNKKSKRDRSSRNNSSSNSKVNNTNNRSCCYCSVTASSKSIEKEVYENSRKGKIVVNSSNAAALDHQSLPKSIKFLRKRKYLDEPKPLPYEEGW